MLPSFVLSTLLFGFAAGTVTFDGRIPINLSSADLDASNGPFNTAVHGDGKNPSDFTKFTENIGPTPLWENIVVEQVINLEINNNSIFTPGGGQPQVGFRRTELIGQIDNTINNFIQQIEVNQAVFHVSIQIDDANPLNFDHEVLATFLELGDGSDLFSIEIGSPFSINSGKLPANNAQSFKVLDASGNVLFTSPPVVAGSWFNFAIQVDFNALTLAVFFSQDATFLTPVTTLLPNKGAKKNSDTGEFHIGILKFPLADPKDSPKDQQNVQFFGIQEGDTEGLFFSGVFIEDASQGVSAGGGSFIDLVS